MLRDELQSGVFGSHYAGETKMTLDPTLAPTLNPIRIEDQEGYLLTGELATREAVEDEFRKRFDALARRRERREIVRQDWASIRDGRELGCLLLTLAPEVRLRLHQVDDLVHASISMPECPSWLMPAWMAHLTPQIDDCGSDEKWPEHIALYVGLGRRWLVLDASAWRRLYRSSVAWLLNAAVAMRPKWAARLPEVYRDIPGNCRELAAREDGGPAAYLDYFPEELPALVTAHSRRVWERGGCVGALEGVSGWESGKKPAFVYALEDARIDCDCVADVWGHVRGLCANKRRRLSFDDRFIAFFFEGLEREITKAETRGLRSPVSAAREEAHV